MPNLPDNYRERAMQRQEQQSEDRNKKGLGGKSVLDLSRSPIKVRQWKPRYLPDENAIDILPFVVSEVWFEKLRSPAGRPLGIQPGEIWYKLEVPIHRNVGPENETLLCLREAFGYECVQCDDMFRLYEEGKKKEAGRLRPQWRDWYNVADYDDNPDDFQIFESSYYTFENTSSRDPQRANLLEAMRLGDGGVVPFWDYEIGSIVVAKFKKMVMDRGGKGKPVDYPEVDSIVFEKRSQPYTMEELEGRIYPLDKMLIIPTVEQFQNAYYGLNQQEEEGEETPERERVNASSGRQRTRDGSDDDEQTGRQRQTRRQAEPPSEDEQEDVCPAGGEFGVDCNSLPSCNGKAQDSCSEQVYESCLNEHDRLSQMANDPDLDPPKRTREPAKTTARQRQRSDTPKKQASSGRTRQRR